MNTLIEWIPILVSAASLFISYYLYKETKSNNQNMLIFDKQKEHIRRQEKKLDDVISRLNSRSNFIPFFNIELDDKNIKFEERDKKTHVVICTHKPGQNNRVYYTACNLYSTGDRPFNFVFILLLLYQSIYSLIAASNSSIVL